MYWTHGRYLHLESPPEMYMVYSLQVMILGALLNWVWKNKECAQNEHLYLGWGLIFFV